LLGGAPFDGPIAEVRVGRVDGSWVLNPSMEERDASDVDLVVAGKEDSIVMVEGELKEVSEDDVVEALEVAHEAIRKLCQGQRALAEAYGKVTPFEYQTIVAPPELVERVRELAGERLREVLRQPYDK